MHRHSGQRVEVKGDAILGPVRQSKAERSAERVREGGKHWLCNCTHFEEVFQSSLKQEEMPRGFSNL